MTDPLAGVRNASIAVLCLVLSICIAVFTYTVVPGLQKSQQAQARIVERADQGAVLIEEAAIVVGARFLQSERLLPARKADELTREAIENVKRNGSPRLATILEALDERFSQGR